MSSHLPQDLIDQLAANFSKAWTSYRVQLRRCQKKTKTGAVHDLRTSIRRLTANIQLAEELLPAERKRIKRIKRNLKTEIHCLRPLRDYQVQVRELEKEEAECSKKGRDLAPLIKFVESEIERESSKVSAMLHAPGKSSRKKIEEDLLCLHFDLTEGRVRNFQAVDKILRRHLSARYRYFQNASVRARPQNAKSIHRVRIEFKKFRYAREIIAPILDGHFSDQHERQLEEHISNLQTLLGGIQDHEMMVQTAELFLAKEGTRSGKSTLARVQRLIAFHEMEKDRLIGELLKQMDGRVDEFQPVHKLHAA